MLVENLALNLEIEETNHCQNVYRGILQSFFCEDSLEHLAVWGRAHQPTFSPFCLTIIIGWNFHLHFHNFHMFAS